MIVRCGIVCSAELILCWEPARSGKKRPNMSKFKILAIVGMSNVAMMAGAASAGDLFETNESHSGPYISVSGGGVFANDSNFVGPAGGIAFENDTGYTINGAVGYRFPMRILGVLQPRVEVEGGYIDADIDGSNLAFPGGGETIGDQSAVTIYLNSYLDLRFSDRQRLVPYIGGGVGAAFLDFEARQSFGSAAPIPIGFSDQTVFAGHAAVGATYELTDRLELFGEGRYFRFSDVDLAFAGPPAFNDDGRIDGYMASAGLRWRF
ncbi:MAG TPA: hypothetical protein DDZ68_16545 [Parvularcula sp.]|nr:hypothetical protein [Parvularcula sp.]